MTIARESLCC